MPLRSGTRLGPYEIVAPIGAGGMGEVYKATDTRLGRTVAIKILPAEFISDAMRTRFEREAKAISTLNHPHICSLFDVGENYLVMEHCEGQTLAQRLERGALPLGQVLEYGIQIAKALEQAHRGGIVHRDLKPSNVMLTKSGVKLLDFGLAKQRSGMIAVATETNTVDVPLTGVGKIVGTIPYMSPEALTGGEADARSDIFAFGLVLYEMATGKPAFTGSSQASLIAAILEREPVPLRQLQPATPMALERLIRACVAKDPLNRIQTAHDAMLEITWIQESQNEVRDERAVPGGRWWFISSAIVAALITAYLIGQGRDSSPRLPQTAFSRLTHDAGVESGVAISPDSKFIAYVRSGDIYLRRVGGQKSINLTEDSKENDVEPAFSPDGQSIAFRSGRDGGGIYVMGATGESVKRLTDFGASPDWSPDGHQLVISTIGGSPVMQRQDSVLWKVDVLTGEKVQLTDRNASQPSWSPSGNRIAFSERRGPGGHFDIVTMLSKGGEVVPVTNDAELDLRPKWSADGNYLYFLSDRGGVSNLWRVAINERTGQTSRYLEPVTLPARAVADFSLTGDGRRIAYTAMENRFRLLKVKFDPVSETATPEMPVFEGSLSMLWPEISPDGEWIIFNSRWELDQRDIYVMRSDGSELRQLTNDAADDIYGHWFSDGKRIAFTSDRGGKQDFWIMNADGSEARLMARTSGRIWNSNLSPDGKRVSANTGHGALIFDLQGEFPLQNGKPLPPYPEKDCNFAAWAWSPNGQWLSGLRPCSSPRPGGGVVLYSLQSGEYITLTTPGGIAFWLSDNRRLMFAHQDELWIVDRETRKAKKFYSSRSPVASITLSRDDRAIYFTSQSAESDIWVMNITDQ